MQLNELIESEGVEVVSEKTNISVRNLNSLLNEEFEELNRVKALGFLTILRREYGLEVDALESSIKNYFEENSPQDGEPILVSIDKTSDSSGFFKWLMIFALLAGLWYLYSNGSLDGVLNNSVENRENHLNDNEALESNVSEDDADKIEVKEDEKNKAKVEIKTVEDTVAEIEEKVAQETQQSDVTINHNESNQTIKHVEEEVEEIAETVTKNIEESNKTVAKVNTEDTLKVEDKVVEEVVDEEEKANIIYNLTINPTRGMLWYGFINLDTKEHKEFMNKVSTPFDLEAGRWILVTGHGYVDIVSDVKTVSIADKVKHYFYIDSTEIREIDRKEFRTLNNGKGW